MFFKLWDLVTHPMFHFLQEEELVILDFGLCSCQDTEPDTHHLKRLRWQRKLVEIINSE